MVSEFINKQGIFLKYHKHHNFANLQSLTLCMKKDIAYIQGMALYHGLFDRDIQILNIENNNIYAISTTFRRLQICLLTIQTIFTVKDVVFKIQKHVNSELRMMTLNKGCKKPKLLENYLPAQPSFIKKKIFTKRSAKQPLSRFYYI